MSIGRICNAAGSFEEMLNVPASIFFVQLR